MAKTGALSNPLRNARRSRWRRRDPTRNRALILCVCTLWCLQGSAAASNGGSRWQRTFLQSKGDGCACRSWQCSGYWAWEMSQSTVLKEPVLVLNVYFKTTGWGVKETIPTEMSIHFNLLMMTYLCFSTLSAQPLVPQNAWWCSRQLQQRLYLSGLPW